MRCCFCVVSVIVWFVCALVCDGVWCVCVRVRVFLCVVCAACFLFYLNVFVCFVWDVLCDDVRFVLVFVFVCVRLMCFCVVSVEYCVMLCGVLFLFV